MTPLQQYVAEEIAVDHADGLMSRREALRRLGLLGVGLTAATALLAACSSDSDSNTEASATSSADGSSDAAPPGLDTALPTEAITFAGPTAELQAAWAAAADPRGAVLVVHENKGLTDHIRSVAGRFAGVGYSALAIDLLSEEGGTATFADPAEATAALTKATPERLVADMKAAIDELQRRVPGKKVGAIGFCMGGALVWRLLGSGEQRLSAAAPFYGPIPDGSDLTGANAAVLAVYAELDARVNASRDAATAALDKAGLTNEVVTVAGADHAFFNDTGQRYDPQAAAQIWPKVLDWYGKYL
ncbi:dienelactone hydrolase family protein [Antrihabitans sp. YC3-6]|uniref:Dienelactone hydrolase family protein n=1 Tax=Antrihabitans stalagmiti TaxID=2799499 RepID=A0A934NN06_9NOCA|nr:dienelactone hydrolase family protein [Antrihabitans stalagmiti]MBJ8338184.1 dienelactone hydrolase family protein [Antrihabitans stalagmiti]